MAQNTGNSFKILHDIVTCNKHVRVDREFYSKNPNVHHDEKLNYLTTQDRIPLTNQDGHNLITQNSKVVVYFDNEPARDVLESAIKEFN